MSAIEARMPEPLLSGTELPTTAGRRSSSSEQRGLIRPQRPQAKHIAVWSRHEESDGSANALFLRGRSYVANEQYIEAIADLREADRLGNTKAGTMLWWATNRLGDQLRDQGRPVEGLLVTWTNLLDLTLDVRKTIELRELKSNVSYWMSIGALHAQIAPNSSNISECDKLTSFPFDPLRVASGVPFDAINATQAIAACDQAIKRHPDEPRFVYQRARAYSRAARVAIDGEDWTGAKASDGAAIADLKSAIALGYPAAFNNMAYAFLRGEGLDADADKAAQLFMETLNRTIYCCWVPVARHLLEEAGKHDPTAVRRVVGKLTPWAAALGSAPARDLMTELTSKGAIDAVEIDVAASFADVPPWFRP
jgi:tetratricopeptide (TPR) repeat protein